MRLSFFPATSHHSRTLSTSSTALANSSLHHLTSPGLYLPCNGLNKAICCCYKPWRCHLLLLALATLFFWSRAFADSVLSLNHADWSIGCSVFAPASGFAQAELYSELCLCSVIAADSGIAASILCSALILVFLLPLNDLILLLPFGMIWSVVAISVIYNLYLAVFIWLFFFLIWLQWVLLQARTSKSRLLLRRSLIIWSRDHLLLLPWS